ncbi:hypothetical protein L7F22_030896 [Adiantum nelumboides]|nr:hypothetical protein [Adiantum nelumboides]
MVKKAIDRMRTGRAYDHYNLVEEHFIHARDLLAELIAVMFNCAMCEGLLDTWSLSTIVPIFKSGDPMQPDNYHTIMIGHTLARLYASILEQQLSRWAQREGICAAEGQTSFKRGFPTLDRILTPRAIIEEGQVTKETNLSSIVAFLDFRKAFDTMPRARLMRRFQEVFASWRVQGTQSAQDALHDAFVADEHDTLTEEASSQTSGARKRARVTMDVDDEDVLPLATQTTCRWSMGKDNCLHREMPEQTTVSAQYGGIGLDQSNFIPWFDKNESSTSVEAYLATKGQSCLDAVSTPALPQNISRPGISQVAIEARPRRYVSGFEEDRQNAPNQLEHKTELTANLCNLQTLDSLKGDCSFPGIPLTCFPKSVGTGRNKWRAASKSTTNAVQSSTSLEIQKIQEEIEEREIRWKHLETSMRADLNRRKLQLHEANIL